MDAGRRSKHRKHKRGVLLKDGYPLKITSEVIKLCRIKNKNPLIFNNIQA